MVSVVVDVDDLGELVVVDDRVGQRELLARLRSGCQQVRLRADARRHRRHDLFSNRIERRVRHLCEQLLEVVEEQARAFRQHGERGVGAHRAERFHALRSHRRDQDLQFLVGVAEHLLAAQHAVVAEHHVLAFGQIRQVDHSLLEPLPVRMLRGQRSLDLVVVDDASLIGVDQEHLARLQPTLGDDLGRVDVDHADLRRHDDEVVVGDPVPARSEPVAVEHRADHLAVGEGDARRSVPGFHHRGVEPEEVTQLLRHRRVVLPRRRNHHHHGVMQRIAAEMEQLEHLVEAGRVRRARRADRERPIDPGQALALEHRLAGPHPVLVALHGVDLAVVRHEPVGVGQRPGREGVRGEAGVHQQERRLDPRIGEVGEELAELRRRQHALVDDRSGRQRREVRVELVDELAA